MVPLLSLRRGASKRPDHRLLSKAALYGVSDGRSLQVARNPSSFERNPSQNGKSHVKQA